MKTKLLLACLLLAFYGNAQTNKIKVNGRHILGPCGDTLILKGVNYSPYNWGNTPSENLIEEIALSDANAIRLVWYGNSTNAVYQNLTMLDSALSKCVQNDIIPIVELHDATCGNDHNLLLTLATWFTQPAVKNLITKYQHSIIINIANEALQVDWTSNPAAASTAFVNTYKNAISTIRNAQIDVPIMIDAPDCGMSIDRISDVAGDLQSHDPEHNLIFSAHTYWWAYNQMDSTTIRTKLLNAKNKNYPLVLGEVANYQDDATYCAYNLNYKPVLRMCEEMGIGWLAWSYYRDLCTSRQLSTSGAYSALSSFGNDIFNNSSYGINNGQTHKSQFLVNDGCGTTSIKKQEKTPVVLYPNPVKNQLHISIEPNAKVLSVEVLDNTGRLITSFENINQSQFILDLKGALNPGNYLLKVKTHNDFQVIKFTAH